MNDLNLACIGHGHVCTFVLFTDLDCAVSTEESNRVETPFYPEGEHGFWPHNPNTIILVSMGLFIAVLIVSIACFKCRGKTRRSTFHGSSGDQMMKETTNAGSREDISDTGKRRLMHYQQPTVPKNVPHGCSTDIKCETNLQPGFQQTVAHVEGTVKRSEISRESESGRQDREGYPIPMRPLKGVSKEIEEYHEYNYPDAKSIQEYALHSINSHDDPSNDSPDIQIHHHYHQGSDSLRVGPKEAHDKDYYCSGHLSSTSCDDDSPSITSSDIQIHHHYHQGSDLLGYGLEEVNYKDSYGSGHHSATSRDDHNPPITSPDTQIHHHYHQGSESLGCDCKDAQDEDYHVYVVPDEDSINVREETDGFHSYYYPDAQFFSKATDSHVQCVPE